MNPKPIQRRFYKTAAARDAAIERVKAECPDCIIKAWCVTGTSPWSIEKWDAIDYLRKMFPGATLPEIIEAIERSRDLLFSKELDKKVAGIKGASATQGKGEKHRDKIRAAFMKLRGEYHDAKKDWVLYHLVKNAHPKTENALLPKTRGYGERSIKSAVRDLK